MDPGTVVGCKLESFMGQTKGAIWFALDLQTVADSWQKLTFAVVNMEHMPLFT